MKSFKTRDRKVTVIPAQSQLWPWLSLKVLLQSQCEGWVLCEEHWKSSSAVKKSLGECVHTCVQSRRDVFLKRTGKSQELLEEKEADKQAKLSIWKSVQSH